MLGMRNRKTLTFFLLLEPRKSGGSFLVLSKSTGRSRNIGHVENGRLAICSISTTILCKKLHSDKSSIDNLAHEF